MAGINTNVASLFAQNNLNKTGKSLGTAIERLSSGLRINSAKDDAAGLAIADSLRARTQGQEVAKRNAGDAISALEIADGAASSITDSLQRMRELAVQSATGTLSTSDRAKLDVEYQALSDEIDRVAGATNFNGIKLLNNTIPDPAGAAGSALTVQIGDQGADTLVVTFDRLDQVTGGLGNILAQDDANAEIAALDTALGTVNTARSKYGAATNRLDSIINNLGTSTTNLSNARGRIIDADFAKETAALTRAQILQQAGTSVLAQANQLPSSVLSLLQ